MNIGGILTVLAGNSSNFSGGQEGKHSGLSD